METNSAPGQWIFYSVVALVAGYLLYEFWKYCRSQNRDQL